MVVMVQNKKLDLNFEWLEIVVELVNFHLKFLFIFYRVVGGMAIATMPIWTDGL